MHKEVFRYHSEVNYSSKMGPIGAEVHLLVTPITASSLVQSGVLRVML
jgi:hypothetical protein